MEAGFADKGVTRETPADSVEIEALFDTSFSPGREALSSYNLRVGVEPLAELCLIWRDEQGQIGAAVRNWPVRIGTHEAILLGPLAVHPTHQGEGKGSLLLRCAIERATDLRHPRIMLVGDKGYYARFGFSVLQAVIMPAPTNPERVLGRALCQGAWTGVAGKVLRNCD